MAVVRDDPVGDDVVVLGGRGEQAPHCDDREVLQAELGGHVDALAVRIVGALEVGVGHCRAWEHP